MKRILVLCVLLALSAGGVASAASHSTASADPPTFRAYERTTAPPAWTHGFRIKAGRVPDGWLEARRAAATITPGQIVAGVGLGLVMLLAAGAIGGSLVLYIRPRSLTWGSLTRGRSRAILGRL